MEPPDYKSDFNILNSCSILGVTSRKMSSKPKESDEVFDARWQAYFSRYGQLVFDSILILLLLTICNMQFTGWINFP